MYTKKSNYKKNDFPCLATRQLLQELAVLTSQNRVPGQQLFIYPALYHTTFSHTPTTRTKLE
jgi:hypothetical protein